MGMTDKQFAAYNRQILRRLMNIQKLLKTTDNEKAETELQDIIDDLQKSIED